MEREKQKECEKKSMETGKAHYFNEHQQFQTIAQKPAVTFLQRAVQLDYKANKA